MKTGHWLFMLCFLQCFDTAEWVSGGISRRYEIHVTDSHRFSPRTSGRRKLTKPKFTWKSAIRTDLLFVMLAMMNLLWKHRSFSDIVAIASCTPEDMEEL